MKKIRILHFELDSNPGGIETFLLNLYEQIDRERFQFDFVTRSVHPANKEVFEKLGGHVFYVTTYKKPFRYMRDIQKILEKKYDIIHIHKNSAANILPAIAAKKYSDSVVIVHSHNTRPSVDGAYLLHKLNRARLYHLADVHLACSDAAGRWLYGTHEYKVISNGIEMQKFCFRKDVRDRYRKDLKIDTKDFVIIHVGRFTEQKNHRKLLDIFKCITYMEKNCRLILVGTGPTQNEIKEYAQKLGMGKRTLFLNNRDDVNYLLMAADCFVMPSLYEGLPFAAIEAQATGIPVYLADTISQETSVSDGVQWFSLEDSDREIANLIRIKKVPEQVRIEKNKILQGSPYNIKVSVEQMQKVYDKLGNGR